MKLTTKVFGEIEINEDKVITFDGGIVGFYDLKKFLLIHDEENMDRVISWLQSIDEPQFALPVIDPLKVCEEYNPMIEDELLSSLGDLNKDNMLVLCTVTVPSDITKMTSNLRAPIVVNVETRKACQVIAENEEYEVKYPIYKALGGKG